MENTAEDGKDLTYTQRWIVKALLELMHEKEYSKITVKEIADTAEIARATFYLNFRSKDDVLNQYTEALYTQFRRCLNPQAAPDAYELALTYFTFWKGNLEFIRVLLQQNMFFQLLGRHETWIRDIFGTQGEGKLFTLQFMDPHERDFFAVYQSGGLWHLLKRWVESGAKESPEYLSDVFAKILA